MFARLEEPLINALDRKGSNLESGFYPRSRAGLCPQHNAPSPLMLSWILSQNRHLLDESLLLTTVRDAKVDAAVRGTPKPYTRA